MSNNNFFLAKEIFLRLKTVVGGKSKLLHKPYLLKGNEKKYLSECIDSSFVSPSGGKFIEKFEKKIPGFVSNGGLLMAPETRTSAPVTIVRSDETLESFSHAGLYPCGEGAGYAGGITSAAIDGVKVAEQIARQNR